MIWWWFFWFFLVLLIQVEQVIDNMSVDFVCCGINKNFFNVNNGFSFFFVVYVENGVFDFEVLICGSGWQLVYDGYCFVVIYKVLWVKRGNVGDFQGFFVGIEIGDFLCI